jgi:glycosyltransferase involved in cell wall biosynthesis
MKILHIIPSIEVAGAEMILLNLVSNQSQEKKHLIVCLDRCDSALLARFMEINIEVLELHIRSVGLLRSFLSLIRIVKMFNPYIIQTWMSHSNLIGCLLTALTPSERLVWSIHSSGPSINRTTRFVEWLCALLSHYFPKKIIYCSAAAKEYFEGLNYSKKKSIVINNGIDIAYFKFSQLEGELFRKKFDLDEDTYVLGSVARWHPVKDHATLFESASILKSHNIKFKVICAGIGMDKSNTELWRLIEKYALTNYVMLLGVRSDMRSLMNALDLLVCSSVSESFGNVVVEAMSCGTPVLTTDCGGPPQIIGDSRFIIPVRDVVAMSERICMLMEKRDSVELANWCIEKARVYSIEGMGVKYDSVYRALMNE